jgi:cytosine/creatinine deaminase
MGRDSDYNVPRGVARADRLAQHGVTCSLASNNVLNAFTPLGDASLLRMANLYANIAQLGRREDIERCFAMITTEAARLMRLEGYGLGIGDRADLLVLPSPSAATAIRELAQPCLGFKRGRKSFMQPPAELNAPA